MWRLAMLAAIVVATATAACGSDSDGPSAGDATTGAGAESGDAAVTAKELNKLSIPDEFALVERLAAADPEAWSGVNPRSEAFRQAVFINAAQAKPDTLISDLVAQACKLGRDDRGVAR